MPNSFLENNLEKYSNMNKGELIKIAIEAVKKAEDVTIKQNNIDIIIVGKEEATKLLNNDEKAKFLK